MSRAHVLRREKIVDEDGNIVEINVWLLATADDFVRVRYRLAFIRRDEDSPAILYDNHAPKGPHRHVQGVEEPYEFVDTTRLLADFAADVRRFGGHAPWPVH